MGLPVGQQRVLDGIAERLRMTEPRLASMFAIFTRLSKGEPPPRREQLRTPGAFASLAAAWHRPARWDISSADIARGRRTRRMMLLISQLAIAFIVVATLLGLSAHASARCGTTSRPAAAAGVLRLACTAPVGGINAGGK